ncbi:MAG: hypothetical protein LUI05_01125 [Oscillospiraceae bacterium]|nr:hypothetical protein [Oscillospiraceae bacterium]
MLLVAEYAEEEKDILSRIIMAVCKFRLIISNPYHYYPGAAFYSRSFCTHSDVITVDLSDAKGVA